jgi:hypothetical protein
MREITAHDHELGRALPHERAQVAFHLGLLCRPGMQVGDLQDA